MWPSKGRELAPARPAAKAGPEWGSARRWSENSVFFPLKNIFFSGSPNSQQMHLCHLFTRNSVTTVSPEQRAFSPLNAHVFRGRAFVTRRLLRRRRIGAIRNDSEWHKGRKVACVPWDASREKPLAPSTPRRKAGSAREGGRRLHMALAGGGWALPEQAAAPRLSSREDTGPWFRSC